MRTCIRRRWTTQPAAVGDPAGLTPPPRCCRQDGAWSEQAWQVAHPLIGKPCWNPVLMHDADSGETVLFFKVRTPPEGGWGVLKHWPPRHGGNIQLSWLLVEGYAYPPRISACKPGKRVRLEHYEDSHADRYLYTHIHTGAQLGVPRWLEDHSAQEPALPASGHM